MEHIFNKLLLSCLLRKLPQVPNCGFLTIPQVWVILSSFSDFDCFMFYLVPGIYHEIWCPLKDMEEAPVTNFSLEFGGSESSLPG